VKKVEAISRKVLDSQIEMSATTLEKGEAR